jgi:hypothetical protein
MTTEFPDFITIASDTPEGSAAAQINRAISREFDDAADFPGSQVQQR